MAKSEERLRALQLRKEGKSIKEIAKSLGVSVGSVSTWVRSVVLTDQQIELLSQRSTDPYYGRKKEYLNKLKKRHENKVAKLHKEGLRNVGNLSKREIFLIGSALYWGEGFKKDRQVGLASLDKDIARFFIYWLKSCFDIKSKDLIVRVTANVSYKSQIDKLEEFWSKYLQLPRSSFSKPYFQNTRWKKQYDNPENYHGVIRIKVRRSVNLLRRIHGVIEGMILKTE